MVLVVLPSWPTSCVFDQSLVRLTLRFRQQQKKPKIFFRSTKLEAGLRTKWLARAQRNAIEKNREIEPAANSVACPPVGASLRARNEEREREREREERLATLWDGAHNKSERAAFYYSRSVRNPIGARLWTRLHVTGPESFNPSGVFSSLNTYTHTHTHTRIYKYVRHLHIQTHTHTHTQPHSWLPPVFRIHRPRLHLRGH